MSLTVEVAVRLKPISKSNPKSRFPIRGNFGQYEVDYVYTDSCSQQDVFNGSVVPLVNRVLEGKDSLLLMYGASCSGKTYTLEGIPSERKANSSDGIIQCAAVGILKDLLTLPRSQYSLSAAFCGLSAAVDASIVDLLAEGAPLASLKDVAAASIFDRLQWRSIESKEDVDNILMQGRRSKVAVLNGYPPSSSPPPMMASPGLQTPVGIRAGLPAIHTMLVLQLTRQDAAGQRVVSRLSFVELSPQDARDGLGRPSNADPSLARNMSLALSSLMSVMIARKQQQQRQLVPWRDNALTRWLREVMEPAEHVLVIATVAPGPEAASDTLATLSYVSRFRTGSGDKGVLITAAWDHGVVGAQGDMRGPSYRLVAMPSPRKIPHLTPPLQLAGQKSIDIVMPSLEALVTDTSYQESTPLDFRSRTLARNTGDHLTQIPAFSEILQSPQPSSIHSPSNFTQQAMPVSSTLRDSTPASAALPTHLPHPSPDPVSAGGLSWRESILSAAHSNTLNQVASTKDDSTAQPNRTEAEALSSHKQALKSGRTTTALLRQASQHGNDADLSAYLEVLRVVKKNGPAGVAAEASLEFLLNSIRKLRSELGAEKDKAQAFQLQMAAMIRENGQHTSAREQELHNALDDQLRKLEASERRFNAVEAEHQARREAEDLAWKQKERDWQLQYESCQAMIQEMEQVISSKQGDLGDASKQLIESQQREQEVRAERDSLQQQVSEVAERLQRQVLALTEEAARVKARALEAANRAEKEELACRAAEGLLAQARVKAQCYASAEVGFQRRIELLEEQLREVSRGIEELRAERSQLQDLKWRADERIQVLTADVESLTTAKHQAETEGRVQAAKVESLIRSAQVEAETAKMDLARSTATVEELKQKVTALQSDCEEQRRLESSAARDLKEAETMLREFDRGLEAQCTSVWKEVRTDNSAAFINQQADGSAALLSLSARWRPLLKALLTSIQKLTFETDQGSINAEEMRARIVYLEEQVSKVEGLNINLQAYQERNLQQTEDLTFCKAHLQRLEEEMEYSKGIVDQLQSKLRSQEQELQAADADLLLYEERGRSNAAERQSLLEKLAGTQTDMDRLQTELEGTKKQAFTRSLLLDQLWDLLTQTNTSLAVGVSLTIGSPFKFEASQSRRSEVTLDWEDQRKVQEAISNCAVETRSKVSSLTMDLQQLRSRSEDQSNEISKLKAELDKSSVELRALQSESASLNGTVASVQAHCDDAKGGLRRAEMQRDMLQEQVSKLEMELKAVRAESATQLREIAELNHELQLVAASRDTWQSTAHEHETRLADLARSSHSHESEMGRLRAEAQASASETQAAQQKCKRLEAEVRDLHTQLEVLKVRLATSERTLKEAQARTSELNSQLALRETDARIKVQELETKMKAGEEVLRLSEATHREAISVQERVFRESSGELKRLEAEAVKLRAERAEAMAEVDDARRQLAEFKAKLSDADFVQKQLQKVKEEREELLIQVLSLKSGHAKALQEVALLQQQLSDLKQELQAGQRERMVLIAKAEASKLDSAVSAALSIGRTTSGRALEGAAPSYLTTHHTASGIGSRRRERIIPSKKEEEALSRASDEGSKRRVANSVEAASSSTSLSQHLDSKALGEGAYKRVSTASGSFGFAGGLAAGSVEAKRSEEFQGTLSSRITSSQNLHGHDRHSDVSSKVSPAPAASLAQPYSVKGVSDLLGISDTQQHSKRDMNSFDYPGVMKTPL
ncbi:hypothetical protein CEUSTIGMA_g4960.t1 [Chlamydomonas eustigma]|uniref:Kinesin motor domain-containing protein n=1 Tax=Chlamydomonas eustigma TaxID=1157962 RepID=A0A250X387_9CHLO|nr:hypothetical protein CEUSTIGMA_g4960.t1 [Chlamydomonas eustigma]|eukprot:GAX77516.1 hypothetical protein CEUSTIGMA_g4960.t1 [Chlamydomonas eustigma]